MVKEISNEVGILGVILVLVVYFLLQWGKIRSDSFMYSFINLLGGIGIMYSLFFEWNLSAFFMELAWIAISLYGLVRYFIKRAKPNP